MAGIEQLEIHSKVRSLRSHLQLVNVGLMLLSNSLTLSAGSKSTKDIHSLGAFSHIRNLCASPRIAHYWTDLVINTSQQFWNRQAPRNR